MLADVVMFVPPYDCSACRTTKIGFGRLKVPFEVVVADGEVVQGLRSEGFSEFPVVKVDCGGGASWSWSGYRHDEIKRVADLFK